MNDEQARAVTRLCNYIECVIKQFSTGKAHFDMTMAPGLIDEVRDSMRDVPGPLRCENCGQTIAAHGRLMTCPPDREVLRTALQSIASIENSLHGVDWGEIELARRIASNALSGHAQMRCAISAADSR